MAGVSTSLSLQDKMTNIFNKQVAAADKLINRMGKLDTVTKQTGGSSSLPKMLRQQTMLEKSQQRIYSAWMRVERGVKGAAKKVSDFYKRTKQAQMGADRVAKGWGRVGTAIAAAFSIAAVMKFFSAVQKTLDAFNQRTKYEVQLSTVMANQGAGAGDFSNVIAAAEALEKKTTYEADGLIGGAAELGTYLKDPKALEAMLPTLADYAAGMGGMNVTAEQMVQYATDLGKALDGTYDGLLKKGFILTDAQKQIIEFGTDMERVAVITDVINQSWAGLAEAFANTPEGKMRQFANAMGQVAEQVGSNVVGAFLLLLETVQAFVQSEAGQYLVSGLSIAINVIITALTWLVSGVQWLANAIVENWAIIQPILLAVGLVLLPLLLSHLWAMVTPLLVQAGLWLMMNWPILLIIAAVAFLMYKLAEMGVTFEDVCGFIGSVLGGLFAFFWNLVADIWNFIAIFAEFFGNVFNDPIGAIVRLFIGLADFVLGVLQTIANALDAVFGSNMAGTIQGWRDSMQAWADDKFGEQSFNVERMEKKDAATLAAEWGAKGRGFGAGITGGLAGFTGGFDTSGLAGNFGGMGDEIPDIGSVGEVGKIKDEVDISEEDLKLLRDIAEARFVQNFVTLTPQVSLRVDTVNENADIDYLLDQAEQRLEEEFAAAAEGVYN